VRAPTDAELAAIAAAYLRLTAPAVEAAAVPSRWRRAARDLGVAASVAPATWREAGRLT
jgi:hypothetical protein